MNKLHIKNIPSLKAVLLLSGLLISVGCNKSWPILGVEKPIHPPPKTDDQQINQISDNTESHPSFPFLLPDAQKAAIRTWQRFTQDGRYHVAKVSDFKMPGWTKTVYYSKDIDSAMKYPYCDGDINRDGRIDDFALIVVDMQRNDESRYGIVIFNLRKDGKSYDGPYWLYQNSDLSKTVLGRSSGGPMHVTQYREDGTYRFCDVRLDRRTKEYQCDEVR